jgi:predicted O-methyltransferase YrrM
VLSGIVLTLMALSALFTLSNRTSPAASSLAAQQRPAASSLAAQQRSSFFPQQKYFDVFNENDAPEIAKHYAGLVKKYESELRDQRKRHIEFWAGKTNTDRCVGRVGMIEASMLYIMIREDKPSHVLEIGALCGTSTRWILDALKINGKGMLSTFDLHDWSKEYMDKSHVEEGRWDFHFEDVFKFLKTRKGKKMQETIDLFFIDALHRNSFAQVYTRELLAAHPHRVSVFVHDIYAPFLIPPYKECQQKMDLATYKDEIKCVTEKAKKIAASKEYHGIDIFYGPTQPGGEGGELTSWLARTGRSNGIVTFSPYAAPTFAMQVIKAFQDAKIPINQINNPAVFFELNGSI